MKRTGNIWKPLAILLGITLLFSMTACRDAEQKQNGGHNRKQQEISSRKEALNPKENVTVSLWIVETEESSYHEIYENAVSEFEEDYPKIKIDFGYYESESYKTKLKNAVATNELPDVFFSWQGGFSQNFAESGKLLNLEPYYEQSYQTLLPEEKTQNSRYEGGELYGVGFSSNCSVLMYNKAILERCGLKPPDTWAEFMEVCRALSNQGITPLAVSMKDTWCLACIHDQLIVKSVGHDAAEQMICGEMPYEGEACIFAAEQMRELADMPAFFEDAAQLSYNEQLERFKEGKAAMMVQLDINCQDVYNTAEDPEIFAVREFPVVNRKIAVTEQVGGTSEGFFVNAASEYPDISAYMAFELACRIGAMAQEKGITISPWNDLPEPEDISGVPSKLRQINEQASSFTLWFDTAMTGDNAGRYLSLLQQLCTGKISAEKFVDEMKEQLEQRRR